MKNQIVKQGRAILLQIMSRTINSVEGAACVDQSLEDMILPTPQVEVIAVGKAASSMMQGAVNRWGARLSHGLVITKYGHTTPLPPEISVIEAGHPVSDENSLLAGRALVEFVQCCQATSTLVLLLSGGASALAEVLPDAITLDLYRKINHWLLSQPLTIHDVNRIRKSISLIKGGKLLQHLRTPHCWQLTLSDVAGNDLSVIGSGLLVRDPTAGKENALTLPAWVQQVIPQQTSLTVDQGETAKQVQHFILADNEVACDFLEKIANELNLNVYRHAPMQGDAAEFAQHVVQVVKNGDRGLYVWGGETTVALSAHPGTGGRCQHMALGAAMGFAGDENIVMLAVGTDGTDGPGEVAGAMVDGQTITRGQEAGLNPKKCLQHADAGRFLEASGDLIDTGPTGTNVNDLVLVLKW